MPLQDTREVENVRGLEERRNRGLRAEVLRRARGVEDDGVRRRRMGRLDDVRIVERVTVALADPKRAAVAFMVKVCRGGSTTDAEVG